MSKVMVDIDDFLLLLATAINRFFRFKCTSCNVSKSSLFHFLSNFRKSYDDVRKVSVYWIYGKRSVAVRGRLCHGQPPVL